MADYFLRLPEISFASRRTLFESVRIYLAHSPIKITLSDNSALQFIDFRSRFPVDSAGTSIGSNCIHSLWLEDDFLIMPQAASSLITSTTGLRDFTFMVYEYDMETRDYGGIHRYRPLTVPEMQATYSYHYDT